MLAEAGRKGRPCYVGHMGGGFTRSSLRDMLSRLKPVPRRNSPFAQPVKTNEPAPWVDRRIGVEVNFAEWTADGKLRQPVFLGVRDEKNASDLHSERESLQH